MRPPHDASFEFGEFGIEVPNLVEESVDNSQRGEMGGSVDDPASQQFASLVDVSARHFCISPNAPPASAPAPPARVVSAQEGRVPSPRDTPRDTPRARQLRNLMMDEHDIEGRDSLEI
jgi:hypothetical protein